MKHHAIESLAPYAWKPDYISSCDSWENRIGPDESGKYVFMTYSPLADDTLGESNYRSFLKYLNEHHSEHSEYFGEMRTGHWTYAYFDSIWIAQNAPSELLDDVAYVMDSLSDYPVFDDSDFFELELENTERGWLDVDIDERVYICQQAGISIFAARRDDVPSDDSGYISDYFNGR